MHANENTVKVNCYENDELKKNIIKKTMQVLKSGFKKAEKRICALQDKNSK